MKHYLFVGSLVLSGAMLAAQAQVSPGTNAAESESTTGPSALEEVVVTGTLIRDVAPVGSNTLTITSQDLESTGVVDSNLALSALVPQSSSFMQVLQVGRGSALGIEHVPIIRPNLRDLGDEYSLSGSPTLVLLDGHRVVPAGINQSTVDVGMIPPGLIDHQEIVLDGVSAVYGSDAVGGTINYVPRRRFDTTEVSVNYGFANAYDQVAVDVTSGRKWNGGGVALTYSYAENASVYVGDRPAYALPRNYLLPGAPPTGTGCDGYANISVGAVAVTTPTLAGPAKPCDLPFATLFGGQVHHTGFLVLSQDFSNRVKFDMTGFYGYRLTTNNSGPFTGTARITPANPYYEPIPGQSPTATQTINFSYGSVLGNEAGATPTTLQVGQISPTLTVDLGRNWQGRLLVSYGQSKLTVDANTLNTTRANSEFGGTTLATALNPYNLAATQSPALFSGLTYDTHSEGDHEFFQNRLVADGPILSLPGGELRLAVGAEFMKTNFKTDNTNATTTLLTPFQSDSQSNTALFGEINIPVFGPQNRLPGLNALTLDVSGRFDHYNDFGNTSNPKIALNFEPIDWITVRGNWGTNFRAPNVVDKLGVFNSSIACSAPTNVPGCVNAGSFVSPLPGQTFGPNSIILFVSGSSPNLRPETSTNWAVGADIRPPVVPNLTVSGTYWHIDFTNQIALPPSNPLQDYESGLSDLFVVNPTASQIAAVANSVPNGAQTLSLIQGAGYNTLYIFDDRERNLTSRIVSGVDGSVHYALPTNFGSLDGAFNGAWNLVNVTQTGPGQPFINTLATGATDFRMTLAGGINIGPFRAQTTWQHQNGYDILTSATQCTCQTKIGAFDLLNFSFRYNVNGSSPWLKDLRLTLAVDNVLNADPPILYSTAGTGTNGSTLGRLFAFGVDERL